ncbi:MAG: TlpA disulfide reductase family protein [Gemmataceae bacterium]
MRVWLSAVLAVSLGVVASGGEGKKTENKQPIREQVTALHKAFINELAVQIKDLDAAKTEPARNEIKDRIDALRAEVAEKVLAVAMSDPKDPGCLDAVMFALGFAEHASRAEKRAQVVVEKARDFLIATFAEDTNLKRTFPGLSKTARGRNILRAFHEKTPGKEIKGAALYFLASGMLEEADYPGGGLAPPLSAEKRDAGFEEAEAMLKKAAKEYGNVEVDDFAGKQSIAKAVEGQRFFLNNLTVGQVLPDSSCEDLHGKKVKISDYRGKVVVLDIWATWCGPCRSMIPHERELVKNLKDRPFVFISLSADDKRETLTKFLEKEPMPWVHWWNGDGKAGPVVDYRVQFYPTIYVLDQKGVIRFKHVRGQNMDDAIDVLLKEIKSKN